MLTHKQLRTKALGVAKYEKLDDEFALLDEFMKARTSKELPQAQVAEKIATTQSAVARMESGSEKHSPFLAMLSGCAEALDCKLEIRLVENARSARNLTGRSQSRVVRAAGI